jgi:hypothetical protein
MTRAGKRMADEKNPDAGMDIRAKKDVTLTGFWSWHTASLIGWVSESETICDGRH